MEKAEIKLEIAIEEDSPALCEFYRKFPIEGHVQLLVDRLHNYFAPYEIESDRHVTYVLRTADREILGTATFVIKDVWLGQEKRTVAVARDLRISQDRRAITSWGDQVLPTMAEIEKLFGVDHFFSVLNLSEVRHLNTFVRPRQIRRALPRYYLFRRFNVVSLHGRLPIAHNPLPHLRVVPGSTGRLDELIYYASLKARARDLSTFWDSESFLQKLKRCPGLALENFLLALDGAGNIIGCAAPWSSAGVQLFLPQHYSIVGHNFRQFLKFGKWLGWSRELTKPHARTGRDLPLNFRYLNFLFADNPDIFETLLHHCFDAIPSNEFLVYSQPRGELHLRAPRGWISAEIPFGVYCMVHPDREPPEFLSPRNDRSVEWDAFGI